MSARARVRYGSVSVDIDLDDVLSEVTDDDLKAECVSRGILPKAAAPKTAVASVSLDGDELSEIGCYVRSGDFEGAMIRLERMLPRDLRVFSDKLAGSPCGRGAA